MEAEEVGIGGRAGGQTVWKLASLPLFIITLHLASMKSCRVTSLTCEQRARFY